MKTRKEKSMNKKHLSARLGAIIVTVIMVIVSISCNPEEEGFTDPYAGGKEPVGIKFKSTPPDPPSGPPGTEVTFRVEGLLKWEGQYDFLINNEKAEVLIATDSTVKVKVPSLVSSGLATIVVGEQLFIGPRFKVEGNVSVDPNFGLVLGMDGPIYDYVKNDNGYVLVGAFTEIDDITEWWRHFPGIAAIYDQGGVNADFNKKNEGKGVPATGSILSVSKFSDGKFLISGSFNRYNEENDQGNITRLKTDGTLDDQIINVVNITPQIPSRGIDTVSVYNGGFPGQVVIRSFITDSDDVIAVGDLNVYAEIDYSKSTKTTRFYDYTPIRNIVKTNSTGEIDESYHAGMAGANDNVNDAYMQEDGKVVIVGEFTSFDGNTVNRIVRLDQNGNYDASFMTGTGANDRINTAQYNPELKQVILTGIFTEFNGIPAKGVVLLNENGGVDENFKLREISGGRINFAKVLSTGKILVSGYFDEYDHITRRGFLLLDPDGGVVQDFNMSGGFEGQIMQVIETTSATGNPALILMGFITSFDDERVGNIVRVEITN